MANLFSLVVFPALSLKERRKKVGSRRALGGGGGGGSFFLESLLHAVHERSWSVSYWNCPPFVRTQGKKERRLANRKKTRKEKKKKNWKR